jgi:hypothetical protein
MTHGNNLSRKNRSRHGDHRGLRALATNKHALSEMLARPMFAGPRATSETAELASYPTICLVLWQQKVSTLCRRWRLFEK